MPKAKVILLRPVLNNFHVETQDCINHMKQYCKWYRENEISFSPNDYDDVFVSGSQIVHATRNSLVEAALMHKDWTHCLFIDDDMTFPENTLEVLLKHDKPVIGVSYVGKAAPFHLIVWDKVNGEPVRWPVDRGRRGAVKVFAVGMGVTLIKREVIKAIGKRWFEFSKYKGEDIEFCGKAMEAGFETWVDTELEVGHIGRFSYDIRTLENYQISSDKWLADQLRDGPKRTTEEMEKMRTLVERVFAGPGNGGGGE